MDGLSPRLELRYASSMTIDPTDADEVRRWRKQQRERLIAARLAIPADHRTRLAGELGGKLRAAIGAAAGLTVGIYWPFRGELDLRPLMAELIAAGGRIALPMVVAKGAPLVFRSWAPGEKLEKGVWNIPVPATGREVSPEIVVSPLVGFDRSRYRLGYGGGFYDRTLAAMAVKPRVIGIGYLASALPTIHPQWHDIPMDEIVAV